MAAARDTAASPQAGGSGAIAPEDDPPRRAAARDRVPWLIALVVFAAYLTISGYRLWRLDPTSWDLGVFTEYVKQVAHVREPIVDVRGPGFNMLGDHFDPIVALIAPFFRLFPLPLTLLVAQVALAAVSVIPVSRAAAVKLGTGAGRAIGAAYGFSWGLQQMVNYDFHEIAFAVPLLAFSLSALVCGRRRGAALWALPLVFVKEDQGFTVAAIGILMIILARGQHQAEARSERPESRGDHQADGEHTGRMDGEQSGRADKQAGQPAARGWFGWGFLLIAWGLGWSFVTIEVIIPYFNAAHRYPYWSMGGVLSPGGHFSAGGAVGQLLASPSVKLPTLAMTLLVTAFLAIRSPIVLAAVPNLALRFISTNSAYWGTAWHYSAPLMPIVFIAAIDAMARIRAARARGRATPLGAAMERHGAAAMLAICAALAVQFPLSQLWTPQTYDIGRHIAAADAAMAKVPDGATVETDLDLLAPLAARTDTFWLGNGGNPATQYVVFDTHSTDWQPPPKNVRVFVDQRNPGAAYRQIFADDGVYVFRRISPPRA